MSYNTNDGCSDFGGDLENTDSLVERKPFYRQWWFFLTVGIFLILLISFILWQTDVIKIGTVGYTIFIDYSDVSELDVGAAVYHEGFVIGEVTNKFPTSGSDLKRTEVKIDKEYWELLTEGSVFRQFDNPDSEGGSTRGIEIKEYVETYPPLEKDKVYEGADDAAEEYLQAGEMVGSDLVDKYLSLGELRVTTVLSPDLLNRVVLLETGTLIPQELLFSNALPDDPAWQWEEETTERRKLITVEGVFPEPEAASWGNSTISYSVDSKFFYTDYVLTESFAPDAFLSLVGEQTEEEENNIIDDLINCSDNPLDCLESLAGCLKDIDECLKQLLGVLQPVLDGIQRILVSTDMLPLQNIPIQISLTMPGKIIETNAQAYKGDTATWSLDGEILNSGIELTATSREYKFLPFLLIGLVIMIILAVGLFLLLRNRKKNVPEEQYPETDEGLF